MARIKLGPIVTDIRGTVKECCFSVWKTGVHYLRSLAAIISNPESAFQGQIRDLMALASKRWYDTLTPVQRSNWNEFAQGLTPQEGDPGGILNIIPQNRGIMSGFNAYCMCYTMVRRCAIVLPGTFDDAPLGMTPPSAVLALAGSYGDSTVEITFTDPVTSIAESRVRIWMRDHEAVAHRQLLSCKALGASPAAFTQFRGAQGGYILFANAPGHYLFQADCIQPNGLKGPPSATIEVIVT